VADETISYMAAGINFILHKFNITHCFAKLKCSEYIYRAYTWNDSL